MHQFLTVFSRPDNVYPCVEHGESRSYFENTQRNAYSIVSTYSLGSFNSSFDALEAGLHSSASAPFHLPSQSSASGSGINRAHFQTLETLLLFKWIFCRCITFTSSSLTFYVLCSCGPTFLLLHPSLPLLFSPFY